MSKIKEYVSMYGISHALISLSIMFAMFYTVPFFVSYWATVPLALVLCVYWYWREARPQGRGTWDITKWRVPNGDVYWDSVFDAVSVVIAVIIAVGYRYVYF